MLFRGWTRDNPLPHVRVQPTYRHLVSNRFLLFLSKGTSHAQYCCEPPNRPTTVGYHALKYIHTNCLRGTYLSPPPWVVKNWIHPTVLLDHSCNSSSCTSTHRGSASLPISLQPELTATLRDFATLGSTLSSTLIATALATLSTKYLADA